jgi:CheY-like chemotaxis protein
LARKILLADDSVTAQNMGKKILTDAGYDVFTVSNGSAALKKVAELQPDVIVLDVYMPGHSGLEVCKRLKDDRETARIPILLTVGKLEPFKPEEARKARADAFIVKPFEATELVEAVRKLEEAAPAKPEPKPGRLSRILSRLESSEPPDQEAGLSEKGWENRLSMPRAKSGPQPDEEEEMPVIGTGFRDLHPLETEPAELGLERRSSAFTAEPFVASASMTHEAFHSATPEEVEAIRAAAAVFGGKEPPPPPAEEKPAIEVVASTPSEAAPQAPVEAAPAAFAATQVEAAPMPAPVEVAAAPAAEPPAPVALETKSEPAIEAVPEVARPEVPATLATEAALQVSQPEVLAAPAPAPEPTAVMAPDPATMPEFSAPAAFASESQLAELGPSRVDISAAVLREIEQVPMAAIAPLAGPRWVATGVPPQPAEESASLEYEMLQFNAALAAVEGYATRPLQPEPTTEPEAATPIASLATFSVAPPVEEAVHAGAASAEAANVYIQEAVTPEPLPAPVSEAEPQAEPAAEVLPEPSRESIAAADVAAMSLAAAAASATVARVEMAATTSISAPEPAALAPIAAAETAAPAPAEPDAPADKFSTFRDLRESLVSSNLAGSDLTSQIMEAAAAANASETAAAEGADTADSSDDPEALASIVDNLLNELKPKLIAEIARKMEKKKKR